jgi:hypothetical protein
VEKRLDRVVYEVALVIRDTAWGKLVDFLAHQKFMVITTGNRDFIAQ